jgi:hypothetical protein
MSIAGRLVVSQPIEIPRAVMMHDFAITQDFVLFFDLPLVFSFDAVARGGMPYAFDESAGARIGVLRRDAPTRPVRWLEIEPCYFFHPMNASNSGDSIRIDVARYPELWRNTRAILAPLFSIATRSTSRAARSGRARSTISRSNSRASAKIETVCPIDSATRPPPATTASSWGPVSSATTSRRASGRASTARGHGCRARFRPGRGADAAQARARPRRARLAPRLSPRPGRRSERVWVSDATRGGRADRAGVFPQRVPPASTGAGR